MLAASEWQGISGAVVCAHHPQQANVVVGIIVEHHRPEGGSSLTVMPVSRLLRRERWRSLLAVADGRLPVLPSPSALSRAPYWATVSQLARRTSVLVDRDDWISYLVTAVRSRGGYLWLVGDKWWGKTALAAHFISNLPPDVDGITYFLVQGDADSRRFLAVVNDQLARLLGEDPTVVVSNQDEFRRRWQDAAERAVSQRRHLVLLVEGLDDDDSVGRGQPSVASLLPRLVSEWSHVMVTSRPDPSLPGDVDPAHPLYEVTPARLTPPSGNVQARTRQIEARHGLCPVCKRSDEAEPVPVVVQKGAWTSSLQPVRPLTLEAALALPPPPGERTLFRWGLVLSLLLVFALLGAGCVSVVEGSNTEDTSGDAGAWFWVLLFLIAATWVWIAYGVKRSSRVPARRIWETLRYYHRDRVVFDHLTGEALYPSELQRYLYSRVPSRQPEPGSPAPWVVRPAAGAGPWKPGPSATPGPPTH